MRLCAPPYYRSFCCTADRCRHSCCIGWQIDVDDAALARFEALPSDARATILSSIDTDPQTGTHGFRLRENGRCPHLRDDGLCRIICRHGDALLCDICREHPRFYHVTSRGAEVGIGAACEEACRLILTSDGHAETCEIGTYDTDEPLPSFDAVAEREAVYATLSDRTVPYTKRLASLTARAGMSALPDSKTGRAILDALEYLTPSHKDACLCYTAAPVLSGEEELYAERWLAYLVLRYLSPTKEANEARCALRTCLFLERLYASLLADGQDAFEAARMLSEELEYSEDNVETLLLESAWF
jgi:lysine-N-methylase